MKDEEQVPTLEQRVREVPTSHTRSLDWEWEYVCGTVTHTLQ